MAAQSWIGTSYDFSTLYDSSPSAAGDHWTAVADGGRLNHGGVLPWNLAGHVSNDFASADAVSLGAVQAARSLDTSQFCLGTGIDTFCWCCDHLASFWTSLSIGLPLVNALVIV